MAMSYDPRGENVLGTIDPDEIQEYAVSFQEYPPGILLQTIQWLVDGPFTVDPSTPTNPQGITVRDNYTGDNFLLCEYVRLRCDLTAAEKEAAIGTRQNVTLRFSSSDGQLWDRSFALDVRRK